MNTSNKQLYIKSEVIFNYLPPAKTDMASASMSVLQSFLKKNDINSNIIYWNLIFKSLMSDFSDSGNYNLHPIIPFLSFFVSKGENADYQRIVKYLQQSEPTLKFLSKDYYEDKLSEFQNKINDGFNEELDKIDFLNVKLFAISYQFYQWIPGLVLVNLIKKKHPQLKIIIGGFTNKESAKKFITQFSDFDYAIWGEGEYPILNLYEHIAGLKGTNELSRTIFKNNDAIIVSKSIKEESIFNSYPVPVHDDFKKYVALWDISVQSVTFPINSIRGCNWNKCRFCSLNNGYKYKERDPDSIVSEIEFNYDRFNVKSFFFVDNDILGKDSKQFEKLLDLLIELQRKKNISLNLSGEIIHKNLSEDLIKKIALAGFRSLLIGYESYSDSSLTKMNKRTDFCDNLFIEKMAFKYHIRPESHIILNILNEDIDDLSESMNNLHYLRFFFIKGEAMFHNKLPLQIEYKSQYYTNVIQSGNPEEWDKNLIYTFTEFLIADKKDRFHFFAFSRGVRNKKLWENLSLMEDHYRSEKYEYSIIKTISGLNYREFLNGKVIVNRNLDFITIIILDELEKKVYTYNSLFERLSSEISVDKDLYSLTINQLLDLKIIYWNKNTNRMVSIVHCQ